MKSSDVARIQTRSRALEQVNWRDTRIEVKPGAVACFGRDAVASVSSRARLHGALDGVLCKMNKTADDGVRLHAALDKLLDGGGSKTQSQILGDLLDEELEANQNRILHEPSEEGGDEEDEDEEPAEASEDEGEENEKHTKTKIPYDSLSLDQLQRTLDATFGSGRSRVVAMDTASDSLRLGNPDDNAHDAVRKFGIGFDVNTRARQPWFAALRTWVGKHPQKTTVSELDQPTLSRLLHELRTAA